MVEKRKRDSVGVRKTTPSPSKKKIIIEAQYKKIQPCVIHRIKKYVPPDVKITKIKIDAKLSHEIKKDIVQKLESVRDRHKVGLLIGVIKRAKMKKDDKGHAMAIYRWGDVIYCFDSHGSSRDNTFESDEIFGIMKDVFGCEILKIYKGDNLQAYDKYSVCVGLASNFIMIMANRKTHLRRRFSLTIKESLIGLTMSAIEKNLQAKTLALSKPRSSNSQSSNSQSSKSQSSKSRSVSKSQSSKSQSSKSRAVSKSQSSKSQSSKSRAASKSQSSKSTKSLTPMNINKPTTYMST